MKKISFPFGKKKDVSELSEAACEEMYVLQLCAEKLGENMRNFSLSIQEMDLELEAAAQAIRKAKTQDVSPIRLRAMQNDFRMLVRTRDKRERMLSDFEAIHGVIFETNELVKIMKDQGRYEEIIDLIPEKSLPHLIRSGNPADLYKLRDLLIGINKTLEERLAVTETIRETAGQQIHEESAVTDEMTKKANSVDREMEEIEARFNLNVADTKQDMQPVKVTKKVTDANETATA